VTALSNMAAAARPPGLGDARVPCPHCGGLIHPVAGRCKHCKEDLSTLRAGRPQAATPLPSLVAAASTGNAQPVAAPVPAEGDQAIPVMIPTAREGSQPILPPRPTSQWRMKAQKPRGNWLRHWPMITIVLAVIAMLVAVIIMVLPQTDKHDGKKRLMAPPAPDRMNTDPLGRQSQADPWGDPDQRPQPQAQAPDDQAQNAPPPRQTPDPPKAPPAQDPDDIFGGLSGGTAGGGGGPLPPMGGFLLTMANHACKKLQACPSSGSSTLASVCDGIDAMPIPPMPSASSCPHAQKCLDAIDKLDCNASIDSPFEAVSLLQDCSKAATDC
jgi:hypothetical protein